MSRYLVTGGSGRLGRSTVAVLAAAGHEVVSLDRAPAAALDELPGVQQVQVDLRDDAATRAAFAAAAGGARGPLDGVVHLAAIAVPHSHPDAEIFATNTHLAWTVLDASMAVAGERPARVLMASSPTVIGYGGPGWSPQALPIDETHPRRPWNGYALSKVAVEDLVAMAARRHAGRLHVGAFRPCYVITPEEWAGAPTQQGHTVAERLADPALSAVALFNYVDARDAGAFVLAWLEHAAEVPPGQVFFVSAADSLLTGPVAPALAAHVPGIGAPAALPGSAPVFSSTLAQRLLGWAPQRSWRSETLQHAR